MNKKETEVKQSTSVSFCVLIFLFLSNKRCALILFYSVILEKVVKINHIC